MAEGDDSKEPFRMIANLGENSLEFLVGAGAGKAYPLADPVNILHDRRTSLSVRKRRLSVDTARWAMTRGSTVPFSFDDVCDALEISPDARRAA